MRSESPGVATAREDIAVPVPSGGEVVGTWWRPVDRDARACVVVHPATAVPERLYDGFASYLTGQGLAAVTYGYRGTGRSGSPREHRRIRMRDWMFDDAAAVAAWSRDRHPQAPHLAVGHSVGGHALALNSGTDGLSGFVLIASHAGVTRTIPNPVERLRVGVVLSVLGPALSRTLGYMPASMLGLGEDIPAGAMLEWGRWSRQPGYFFDDPSMRATERAAAVAPPVLAIGFSDDPVAVPEQINAVTDRLTSTTVERRTYAPTDVGVDSIGHMGFFRRSLRDSLWSHVHTWLDQHSRPSVA